jgi:hypothetical protein
LGKLAVFIQALFNSSPAMSQQKNNPDPPGAANKGPVKLKESSYSIQLTPGALARFSPLQISSRP